MVATVDFEFLSQFRRLDVGDINQSDLSLMAYSDWSMSLMFSVKGLVIYGVFKVMVVLKKTLQLVLSQLSHYLNTLKSPNH